jgi:hypothetical protein
MTVKVLKKEEGLDKRFFDMCEKAEIPPTKRQWKKWQKNKGLAREMLRKER